MAGLPDNPAIAFYEYFLAGTFPAPVRQNRTTTRVRPFFIGASGIEMRLMKYTDDKWDSF
ncbi:MAG: hypothetical protein MRJ65_16305 [Candidatus Brocadiaceae bacterium]|nr:hypothetical protein [Candidatus Brocadiaceae bacterium]